MTRWDVESAVEAAMDATVQRATRSPRVPGTDEMHVTYTAVDAIAVVVERAVWWALHSCLNGELEELL